MPDRVAIGRLPLGRVPRLVASIGGGPLRPLAKRAEALGADIIELRCDRIDRPGSPEAALAAVRGGSGLPVISTIRWHREGGALTESRLPERRRRELYSRVIPGTDGVDIEISSRIFREVAREARDGKKTVIASYHNFTAVPPDRELESIVKKGLAAGGHIVKIAAFSRSLREIARLLAFCLSVEPGRLTVIAMGTLGRIGRIAAPLFGSVLVYGHVGRPYGPGQMTVSESRDLLRTLYPRAA